MSFVWIFVEYESCIFNYPIMYLYRNQKKNGIIHGGFSIVFVIYLSLSCMASERKANSEASIYNPFLKLFVYLD